jgi:hypothetical protein
MSIISTTSNLQRTVNVTIDRNLIDRCLAQMEGTGDPAAARQLQELFAHDRPELSPELIERMLRVSDLQFGISETVSYRFEEIHRPKFFVSWKPIDLALGMPRLMMWALSWMLLRALGLRLTEDRRYHVFPIVNFGSSSQKAPQA